MLGREIKSFSPERSNLGIRWAVIVFLLSPLLFSKELIKVWIKCKKKKKSPHLWHILRKIKQSEEERFQTCVNAKEDPSWSGQTAGQQVICSAWKRLQSAQTNSYSAHKAYTHTHLMTHSGLAGLRSLSTSVIVCVFVHIYMCVCQCVIWWVNISGSGAVCWWKECKNREITATLQRKSWRRRGGQNTVALSTHFSPPAVHPTTSLSSSLSPWLARRFVQPTSTKWNLLSGRRRRWPGGYRSGRLTVPNPKPQICGKASKENIWFVDHWSLSFFLFFIAAAAADDVFTLSLQIFILSSL